MSALSMAAPPRIKSTKVDGSLASIALHHLGATFSQHRDDEDMGDIAAGILLVPVNDGGTFAPVDEAQVAFVTSPPVRDVPADQLGLLNQFAGQAFIDDCLGRAEGIAATADDVMWGFAGVFQVLGVRGFGVTDVNQDSSRVVRGAFGRIYIGTGHHGCVMWDEQGRRILAAASTQLAPGFNTGDTLPRVSAPAGVTVESPEFTRLDPLAQLCAMHRQFASTIADRAAGIN